MGHMADVHTWTFIEKQKTYETHVVLVYIRICTLTCHVELYENAIGRIHSYNEPNYFSFKGQKYLK